MSMLLAGGKKASRVAFEQGREVVVVVDNALRLAFRAREAWWMSRRRWWWQKNPASRDRARGVDVVLDVIVGGGGPSVSRFE